MEMRRDTNAKTSNCFIPPFTIAVSYAMVSYVGTRYERAACGKTMNTVHDGDY